MASPKTPIVALLTFANGAIVTVSVETTLAAFVSVAPSALAGWTTASAPFVPVVLTLSHSTICQRACDCVTPAKSNVIVPVLSLPDIARNVVTARWFAAEKRTCWTST